MDEERKARLQQLTNNCVDIANVAAQRAVVQHVSREAFGVIVSRLAAILLENELARELRREEEGLREE